MNNSSSGKRYVQWQEIAETYKAFGLVAAVYLTVMFKAARPLHEWVFTQWMFSYEFGFVKRGLHGEMLRSMGLEISYLLIFAIVMVLLLILNAALILLFTKPLRSDIFGSLRLKQQLSASNWTGKSIHIGLGLFSLMALLHSTSLQRFFQFPGYLEHLQLILVLGGLFFLERIFRRNTKLHQIYSFLTIGVLCFTALFIHEGFLFFYLPMIFMYWVYQRPGSIVFNIFRLILLAALVFQTWLIGTYGLLPADQYQPFLNELQSRVGINNVDIESMRVLFRGFSSNLNFTWNWFEQRLIEKLIHLGFTIIILSPTAYIFWNLYKKDFRKAWRILFNEDETQNISTPKNSFLRGLLILSCFTPLILVPIGIDLFRWISISTLNLFVMTAFLMSDQEFHKRAAETLYRLRYVVVLVIALSLIFGVLGITNSFSWVYKFTTNLGLGI